MAAINFPNNPNIGDTFAAAGKEWQWDGTSWNLLNVVNSLHAATHESGGSDEVELAQSQIINLTTDLSNKASASSLSNHISATTDVHGISNSASLVYTNDSRLSDSRTPLAHAASHSASGSDALTLSQSQITNLTTDLSAKIASTEKGAANGVATLDANSKVPSNQLPAIAITSTYVVNSASAMTDLTAQEGDVAVRTDVNKSFILAGSAASVLANWQELLTPTDAVQSVDGRTGAVTLSDLYAAKTHAATHASAGTDPITISQSQVTNLTTDLSAKAPLDSPTFTGTPAAPTATIGTNTTQIATTAYVRAELTYETTTDLTVTTNATTMNIATGNVGFVASGPTANWTVNFTNVPAVDGQTITATIFVTQGATGYIPSTVQIGGVGQTIKWQGGSAPTPTSGSGKIDAFSFSMIRRGGTWTVLGSMLGNF